MLLRVRPVGAMGFGARTGPLGLVMLAGPLRFLMWMVLAGLLGHLLRVWLVGQMRSASPMGLVSGSGLVVRVRFNGPVGVLRLVGHRSSAGKSSLVGCQRLVRLVRPMRSVGLIGRMRPWGPVGLVRSLGLVGRVEP